MFKSGPVVGGFAATAKGWTWTIWELCWLSGFSLIVLFFFLPETSHANILHRRARRLRKLTGRPNLRCESEFLNEQNNHLIHDIALSTARGFALNFQEPIVFFLNIYTCLIYGLIYAWFESFAVVFGEIYKFSLPIEGVSFTGILVGAIIVLPPYCAYSYYVIEPKFNEKGELKPEERLPFAFVGAFLIPISLFLFGWTSRESIPWIVPIIGSSIFIMGALLLFVRILPLPLPRQLLLDLILAVFADGGPELPRRRLPLLRRLRARRERLHALHLRRRLPPLRDADVS